MELPKTSPRDDPENLWKLREDVMSIAQALLGPRDTSILLIPVGFANTGPYIEMLSTLGRFAWRPVLSRNAESYWPTAVFELAHETVHLLNPKTGTANFLEEGIAVEFSLRIQPLYRIDIKVNSQDYEDALQLVRQLPSDPLSAAKKVRANVGSLNIGKVSVQDMENLFPDVDKAIIRKLVAPFPYQLRPTRINSN